jgi:hypothetical protein
MVGTDIKKGDSKEIGRHRLVNNLVPEKETQNGADTILCLSKAGREPQLNESG